VFVIAASTRKEMDWSRYPDRYTQKLMQLIEAKAAGREIVVMHTAHEAEEIAKTYGRPGRWPFSGRGSCRSCRPS
jgi:non-homologous end joining protein Ku